jgi:thiamine kinase-like enzyme
VTACEQQPVVAFTLSGEAREDGGGLSGPKIVRLKLAYEGGAGPEQMVVKFGNWFDKQQMPPWPLKIRLIQAIANLRLEDQFRSEIRFFQDIRPHIHGVLLPKVYYAAIADTPNVNIWSYVLFDQRTRLRFCVLMEDLAMHQFTSVRPGEGLSFNRAKQALLNIAQLHAFGWNQPDLWDRLQLRPAPWLTFLRADEGQQRKHRDKFGHTDFIPTFLKLWAHHPRQGDHAHGFSMLRDPEMATMLSAFNASFSTWAADAAKTPREAAHTIVHGDFHGWNHLFNSDDECRVVDFQFLGRGRAADDLAYFFVASFDPDPAAEAKLLELYHNALVEAGVQGYAYEQCLHEYYVSTVTLLLGSIVRAVKFLKPGLYDKLELDQKQADLMQVSDLMRDRMMTRALDWYQTPHLQQRFFSCRKMA